MHCESGWRLYGAILFRLVCIDAVPILFMELDRDKTKRDEPRQV